MNRDKIIELANAATTKYDRVGFEIPFAQPDLFEFAGFIVEECIQEIWKYKERQTPIQSDDEYGQGIDEGLYKSIKLIKQHFGVE